MPMASCTVPGCRRSPASTCHPLAPPTPSTAADPSPPRPHVFKQQTLADLSPPRICNCGAAGGWGWHRAVGCQARRNSPERPIVLACHTSTPPAAHRLLSSLSCTRCFFSRALRSLAIASRPAWAAARAAAESLNLSRTCRTRPNAHNCQSRTCEARGLEMVITGSHFSIAMYCQKNHVELLLSPLLAYGAEPTPSTASQ